MPKEHNPVIHEAVTRMHMKAVALSPLCISVAADLSRTASVSQQQMIEAMNARRSEICAAYGFNAPEQRKSFPFANGLAFISITGILINRYSYSGYGVTGYNFIRSQLNDAINDDEVQGIVFDVNSPGGEVAGLTELADEIRASRSKKPSLAVVDTNCYSAAYGLGSAASRIVCVPSGGVGSVGVVMMHIDISEMLADYGYKITFIYESDHKVDGNAYEKLSADVKKDFQADIHYYYEKFCSLISMNMGITEQAVRDTKSRCYRADEAVSLGLIHAMDTPSVAVRAFLDELSGSNHQPEEGTEMSTAPETKPGANVEATTPQADAAKAATEARNAERSRIAAITGCDEAKDRAKLASHLAMNTEMSVDDAKKVLAASATEQAAVPAAAANGFDAAMNASQHPNVGGDSGNGDKPDEKQAQISAILAAQSAATGIKHTT